MSWVIKAAPLPLMPDEDWQREEGFRIGDAVRVIPWEGIALNMHFKQVLLVGGPEGKIVGGPHSGENANDDFAGSWEVEFPRGYWWISPEHLRHA